MPSPPSRDRAFDAVDRLKKAHVCFESMLRMREAWHRQVTEFERIKSSLRRVESCARPWLRPSSIALLWLIDSRVALEAAEAESAEERASRARTWLAAERACSDSFFAIVSCGVGCAASQRSSEKFSTDERRRGIADLILRSPPVPLPNFGRTYPHVPRASKLPFASRNSRQTTTNSLRGACKHGRNGDWLKMGRTRRCFERLIDVAASQNEISSEDQAADTAKR